MVQAYTYISAVYTCIKKLEFFSHSGSKLLGNYP